MSDFQALEQAAPPARGAGAVAEIDVAALNHNLARVRQLAPGSRVLAVVKADAYGHGLVRCARALASADGFAVARMDEAQRLRSAGVQQRLLLLPGVYGGQELERAAAARLDVVVHSFEQIEILEQAPPALELDVWLKVDSGMHRLGVAPEAVSEAFGRLGRAAAVRAPVRLMTHLADADERALDTTAAQVRCFDDCTADLHAERSIGNSAGVIAWPQAHGDWVRPGIMLYGVSPFRTESAAGHGLRPVMTLRAMLIAVKEVRAGGAVGYGGVWVAPHDMPVGSVSLGYADGYPRNAPNGAVLRVGSRNVALVGRVSMDTITLDLRDAPDARPGMPVTAWGEHNPVEILAARCQTIPYELLCRVGSRVPRVSV